MSVRSAIGAANAVAPIRSWQTLMTFDELQCSGLYWAIGDSVSRLSCPSAIARTA